MSVGIARESVSKSRGDDNDWHTHLLEPHDVRDPRVVMEASAVETKRIHTWVRHT